jgi:arsenite-transporting ATPase
VRLVLMTGKGGAGTTTCAAATAAHAAAGGDKTLLLTLGSDPSLGDVCSVTLGADPTELAAGLYAARPGLRGALPADFIDVQTVLGPTLDGVGGDLFDADDVAWLPVVPELLVLLEVQAQLAAGRWDLVVIDCGPTAEALRILTLPATGCRLLERTFSLPRKGLRDPVGGLSGEELSARAAAVFAAARLHARLRRLQDVLADAETTSVRLVITPTPNALAHARRSLTALSLHGFVIDRIIANRMPSPEPATAELIEESFAPTPVSRLFDLPTEPTGVDSLRGLGAGMYGGENPLGVVAAVPAVVVESRGTGFVLSLAIPFAERGEVDLVRRSDELVVTVQDQRRVLLLPSALRRCVVTGAALAGGRLAIDFEPDRDLWLRA